jgi:thymidylate synthase ThyX
MGEIARRIYLMNDLPPEVVAVAFAKTSRSPEPFDQIAAELTESASAQFHEKWVVGYGHASVAEHAILSLAVENVSILAAKAIEDNRLASYTEKSTRYQIYDPRRVYRPANVMADPKLRGPYETLITHLLETYIDWSGRALEHLKRKTPLESGKSERMWLSRLRAQACDSIRYLLPTATLTNLGWTVNARALAHAIRKLGGSPLPELREIADELNTAAVERVPTLLKYCDPDTARAESGDTIRRRIADRVESPSRSFQNIGPEVSVLRHDADAIPRLACAVAYAAQGGDWLSLETAIGEWSTDDQFNLLRESIANLGPFDPLTRAFEHVNLLIEITVDYGAWRDIQRHRIGTQTAQDLTPDIGYTIPPLVAELGLHGDFVTLLGESAQVRDLVHREFPHEAAYPLMMAFRKRSLFGWNLREVFHFVAQRKATTPTGGWHGLSGNRFAACIPGRRTC